MIEMILHFEQFEQFNAELIDIIQTESIPQVAKTHKGRILELTAQGKDAFGDTLHDYNKEYAARLGIPVQPKTLRRKGYMLDSLELDGDTLTVNEQNQDIALGQMTGHDGDWGYEHLFLTTSHETDELAAEELTQKITEAISG